MDRDKIIAKLDRKKDQQRIKTKRKTEENAASGGVFDKYTSVNINKLQAKGIIVDFVGIISAGKEANVYFAYGEDKTPLGIKIYKIDPQNTKWMKNYIIGDPRFKKIGNSTHKIIYTWCKKEFKNLTQLKRHNILVPNPIICKDNVLIMEYIGENNGTPALRLKEINHFEDPTKEFKYIIQQIEDMYWNAHLVHGDLSEFNILYYKNKQIIIDVSQAVSIYHINAPVYLRRDIINVSKFFESFLPLNEKPNPELIFQEIMNKN